MTKNLQAGLTRREMLLASLSGGSAMLLGGNLFALPSAPHPQPNHGFGSARKLKVLEFQGEGQVPMDTPVGSELDGRLFTDLSGLTPGTRIIPTERFYIRTRASQLLGTRASWKILCRGRIQRQVSFSLQELEAMARPIGLHLMECSGNIGNVHFGMLGVAEWSGVPVADILDRIEADRKSTRVMVAGFDQYATESLTSVPGASWIFGIEDLVSTGAFLATHMNSVPLAADHGAPVRLVVPGWYGCACIKWVNNITLVDDMAPATSQMREYASRTLQNGIPEQARDYQPAVIDTAAMPIRVEQWIINGHIRYCVIGILWGGSCPVRILEIRFGPDESYVPVDLSSGSQSPWTFWSCVWSPKATGMYPIQLRIKDPRVRSRRLDAGYYVRSVLISEL